MLEAQTTIKMIHVFMLIIIEDMSCEDFRVEFNAPPLDLPMINLCFEQPKRTTHTPHCRGRIKDTTKDGTP